MHGHNSNVNGYLMGTVHGDNSTANVYHGRNNNASGASAT